jgi:hypothetical protein
MCIGLVFDSLPDFMIPNAIPNVQIAAEVQRGKRLEVPALPPGPYNLPDEALALYCVLMRFVTPLVIYVLSIGSSVLAAWFSCTC